MNTIGERWPQQDQRRSAGSPSGGQRPGGPPPVGRGPNTAPPGRGEPDFWGRYLRDGYFVDGNLRPELVVEDANKVAQRLIQGRVSSPQGFAPAQLRRFYAMAKYLEQRLNAGATFESVIADLCSLQPLARNAVAKDNAPQEFVTFIDKNIDLARHDERSFRKGFLVHFQSVVAYFSYEKRLRGGR